MSFIERKEGVPKNKRFLNEMKRISLTTKLDIFINNLAYNKLNLVLL